MVSFNRPRVPLPWIDGKLKELIKQKHSAWNAYKRLLSSESHGSAFRILRNKVTSSLRSAEKQYVLSLHRDMRLLNRSQSVKRFWTYVKHVTGKIKLSTIPDLEVDQDGTQVCVTSDANKASALNRHFARQTCLTNCPESCPDFAPPFQASPDSFSTTPADVFDVLSGLKWGRHLAWMRYLRSCCPYVREAYL